MSKTMAQLLEEESEILTEQFRYNMKLTSGQLTKNHHIKRLKKSLARVKTQIRQLQLQQSAVRA